MTSPMLIAELADQVELIDRENTGTFALRCPAGISAEQRASLIDTWHGVADELRRRGWFVTLAVDRDTPGTELFCVRIAADE